MDSEREKNKEGLLQKAKKEDTLIFDLKDLENTLVAEIITLMFCGKELEFEDKVEVIPGTEIIGELNLFEKACHVLWKKYEKKNATLELSLSAGKKDEEEIEDEESLAGFLDRAEIAMNMLFDSIFRRHPPELGKLYRIGHNFKILRSGIPDDDKDDCQKLPFGDDDMVPIKLFSAIDAKKVGKA